MHSAGTVLKGVLKHDTNHGSMNTTIVNCSFFFFYISNMLFKYYKISIYPDKPVTVNT